MALKSLLPSKWKSRQRRRTLTGFQFSLAEDLRFLPLSDWREVTQDLSIFHSPELLSAWQDSAPKDMNFHFVLVYRDRRPVAAITTQSFTMKASQLVREPTQIDSEDQKIFALRKLGWKALGKIERRLLVCGVLPSWGPYGVAILPGEDPQAIWPGVAEALYRIRRSDRLRGKSDYVLFKVLEDRTQEEMKPLRDYSYRPVSIDPNMVLELDPSWESLEDYLQAMTKKYRGNTRKILKRIDKAGVRSFRLEDPEAHRETLHRLYRAVAARSELRPMEFSADYLPRLAQDLGPDRFAIRALEHEGELAGYVTILRDRDRATGYYLGVDYEKNAQFPVYLRLLLAVIEQGIEWKVERILFGGTALEPKARLGAKPVPCSVWVRHRQPLANVFVRQILQSLPQEEAPDRNPFPSGTE